MTLEPTIAAWVETTRRLVQLERRAELEEAARLQSTLSAVELERRGVSLLGLSVTDEHSGLGGRTLLELERRDGRSFPPTRIGPGDIVAIRSPREGSSSPASADLTAVVYRLSGDRLTLALDTEPETYPPPPLRLDRLANDITYRRLDEALDQLARYRGGPADRLRATLFGHAPAEFSEPSDIELFEPSLDESQRAAVRHALSAEQVALIHGPPGTGKTTTLAEVIHQAVRGGKSVLACANTNVAVDNLVEKLALRGLGVVRLGHPARLLPSVLEHSLDRLVEKSATSRAVREIRRDLDRLHRRILRSRSRRARRELRDEARRLSTELRRAERAVVRDVITSADVVLVTNVGAADPMIAGVDFDLVVMDEAAQSLEPAAWIPLLKAKRAVLAGDHCQLPPTILSREAAEGGLDVTLFERLAGELGERVLAMLTVQYRMHERIMTWSSRELYGGRIEAHESVRAHLLEDLPGCTPTPDTSTPLLFIDTAGCDLEEEQDEDTTSRSNEGEARVVVRHLEALLEAGIAPADIGVITPYNDQVRLCYRLLGGRHEGLEVGSVDGFQGREKEAVIISLVRSNPRGEVGFLADDRRMNVAVTRARRHVAVIGDSATVSRHPFLERLVAYFQEHGDYRSAWEYLH